MSIKKYSIMILDDHPIIHDALTNLLNAKDNLEIAACAFTAEEAFNVLKINQPDLIIIDLSLQDADGVYLVQRLKSKYPKIRLLVYSMSEEKLFAERSASAGANGYVMKTSSPNILKEAIDHILHGKNYFPDDLMSKLEDQSAGTTEVATPLIDVLSNREMDVFNLIGKGMDTVRISEKLNISRNTVDTHRINIKNKLDLESGKALDRYAFKVINQTYPPI